VHQFRSVRRIADATASNTALSQPETTDRRSGRRHGEGPLGTVTSRARLARSSAGRCQVAQGAHQFPARGRLKAVEPVAAALRVTARRGRRRRSRRPSRTDGAHRTPVSSESCPIVSKPLEATVSMALTIPSGMETQATPVSRKYCDEANTCRPTRVSHAPALPDATTLRSGSDIAVADMWESLRGHSVGSCSSRQRRSR